MRSLLLVIFLFANLSSLSARPLFVVMDATEAVRTPEKFGYSVVFKQDKDLFKFSIRLDANASSKFRSAKLFFLMPGDAPPEIPVKATKNEDGLVTLAFEVPETRLNNYVLHIDSEILRDEDPKINFAGYRLRLDNIRGAKK